MRFPFLRKTFHAVAISQSPPAGHEVYLLLCRGMDPLPELEGRDALGAVFQIVLKGELHCLWQRRAGDSNCVLVNLQMRKQS